MRKLLLAAALIVGFATADALAKEPHSNIGGIRSDEVNESAIRALYTQFGELWNKHDPAGLAAMWAIDGDHVEPDGRHADGRDAILDLLTKQHGSVFKTTVLTLGIEDVWFLTGDVALVDGTYAISGIVAPDGQQIAPRKGNITSVLLREGGKWWIAASRLMIPAELPWRPGAAGAPPAAH
jgi:uncharacterized protein (TIGR02246 family)